MTFCTTCPLPATVGTIGKVDCPEDLNQIVRIAFTRVVAASEFDSVNAPTNPITAIASWTAFQAAVDDTKIQVTPLFENLLIPNAEEITEGGNDNTTTFGEQITLGAGFIKVTGRFRSLKNSIVEELKAYRCETNLGIYMVNEFGQIWGKENTTGIITPIPIRNWYITDAGSEGKNKNDFSNFSFNLKEGWRKNIKASTPADFNALDPATFLP